MSSKSTQRRKSGIRTLPSDDELKAIDADPYKFLEEKRIIETKDKHRCPHCDSIKCSSAGKNVPSKLKCNNKKCKKKSSRLKGTFFHNIKIPIEKAIRIIFYTVAGHTHQQIEQKTGLSNVTVTAFMQHTKQMCVMMVNVEDTVIGGPGVKVEIDESKFGKRKYNRGHRVGQNGVWVFGGIETDLREGELMRRYFAMAVNGRSRAS